MQNRYLKNWRFQAGLWPAPNPDPIGPGLLFFFTAWPAIICLIIGYVQARSKPPN